MNGLQNEAKWIMIFARYLRMAVRFAKESVSEVMQDISAYMARIGFSDSVFLLTILFFPLLRLVSFLLQLIGRLHVNFVPFVMIAMILLLFIRKIRLRDYLIALFYRLLNTTVAQGVLHFCLCCEQLIHSHIGFAYLLSAWLAIVYVRGVLYQHTLLTLSIYCNVVFLLFLVYFRLRRHLFNDNLIHFVATPRGVLWSDALHGLDNAFRTRMGIDTGMGVKAAAPNRIQNRLSDHSNIPFPFFIRTRAMRTAGQETGKSIADWIANNANYMNAIVGAIVTSVGTLSFEAWREEVRLKRQIEATEQIQTQQAEADRQRHADQMEADRRRHVDEMEERAIRSIQQSKEICVKQIEILQRKRVDLDSMRYWFAFDRAQRIQLNETQIQERRAGFEAYQKQQEDLSRSIQARELANQYPVDSSGRTASNSESAYGVQREERAQSHGELPETQPLIASSDSLVLTDYSSFLSQFT